MSEFVKVERDGAVLVVTLARAEKKNALTGSMYEALIAALATASDDECIGALLLEGSGGVFSAGNDIGDFLAYALAPELLRSGRNVIAVITPPLPGGRNMEEGATHNTARAALRIVTPASPWKRHAFNGLAQVIVDRKSVV